MTTDLLSNLVSLALGSLCVAFIALYVFAWLASHRERRKRISIDAEPEEVIFLFDDETIVNATPAARRLLETATATGSDWSRFLCVLLPRFPDLRSEMFELAERGEMLLEARDGKAALKCEWRQGLARLALLDRSAATDRVEFDRHALTAMEQELDTLREIGLHLPSLVWRETPEGTICWANAAYLSLADETVCEEETASWPPATLFDTALLGGAAEGEARRLSVPSPDGTLRWFEVHRFEIGGDHLFAASSVDRTVRAEEALREFTQTLTKTFAHLTIGLAIFDRDRRLALFNPALTDLTSLPPDFLIARPTLIAFLDRLRDRRMMPEPKDYKSWREAMAALETAAQDGTYEELWSLPGGVTYRVSGRPHPDGAIAFLFEDISAEMSLTRRFRAQIETGQAALDSLKEAIAVFSNEGTLVFSNLSYTTLWGLEKTEGLADTSITEATRLWHSKCAPSPMWGDIRDFVGRMGERNEWTGATRLWDGRRLTCRFVPLPSGQTLVGFSPEARTTPLRPPLGPQAESRFLEI
ncbi:PAS-domain containing protein [Celeribacter indicus]|uniref:PAS domain-containing protein n=1 Tax=Celeribacter indicus TaxID=1208324 RepID=A0A0B5DVX2_9RHOB|nr:PAS-domain containing protein [Celeribacter indicus]AJE44906.1 PAS domain-containing protein [Celeribacter indicus]SDW97559.1 PAS fold [Celeribacter indicus]